MYNTFEHFTNVGLKRKKARISFVDITVNQITSFNTEENTVFSLSSFHCYYNDIHDQNLIMLIVISTW